MSLLSLVDDLLNGITMYRLLLYGLGLLAALAIGYGFAGVIAYSGWELLASAAILLISCYVSNRLLGIIFDAATNTESSLITALILFCIMPPSLQLGGLSKLALAGLIAMASKYLLAWRRKHIFNPAAIAPVLMSLAGLGGAAWWVADKPLLPATALLGALIIRKVRKIQVVLFFGILSGVLITIIGTQSLLNLHQLGEYAKGALTSWPTVFLGTVMLTEPSTMPPRKIFQWIYAAIVAVLFASGLKILTLPPTPELAIACGNIFSFLASPKYKLRLTLTGKYRTGQNIWDLVFTPDRRPVFQAGQYMEWTLPHARTDGRGDRRTFTIASSPTEAGIHLGLKTYEPSSSFKTALLSLKKGGTLIAGNISGSFTLPKDPTQKLLFIAGGIGVTPFRSMLKYMIDTQDARDIVLLYIVSDRIELGYPDAIFSAAERTGVHIIPLIRPEVSGELLRREVPDFSDRFAYISGSNSMIRTWERMLRRAGLRKIRTDHFSGY